MDHNKSRIFLEFCTENNVQKICGAPVNHFDILSAVPEDVESLWRGTESHRRPLLSVSVCVHANRFVCTYV